MTQVTLPEGMTEKNLHNLMRYRLAFLEGSADLVLMESDGSLEGHLVKTAIEAWTTTRVIEENLIAEAELKFPDDAMALEAEVIGATLTAWDLVTERVLHRI